ncbi:MAG: undecaprenyldiphospho-muramoylpentapeptide beta-N-acetylglucosaminyltransferase [Bacteroidales bacterium]|nr:undecaprenyldiphospho-muramoylpentapeptide beta-N-acetylglucosaminyltransferase [Bacteroidales bacterium]
MGAKVIISGGGTGGHIFPALSIADSLKRVDPTTEILFVGAIGKMEMEKVPAAGYPIIGLPVAGLQRSFSISNLKLPFKVLKSLNKAQDIINSFRPDVVVGVGGYASAPMLWKASSNNIPCLIQEQNSYAGLTNKILGKRVKKICVAYPNMERFFPADKIIFTGNPIRANIHPYTPEDKIPAAEYFGLSSDYPTVLVVGGSLGCGTLNRVFKNIALLTKGDLPYQIIWQSGKGYHNETVEFFKSNGGTIIDENSRKIGNILNCDFIFNMEHAMALATIVVSRAGAGTISELCAAGKATIFVPSPVVAEDHQTHNAMALVNSDAALMIKDANADIELGNAIEDLLKDGGKIGQMERNILALAKPDAATQIAQEILKLVTK